MSIPSVKLFKKGEIVADFVGAKPEKDVREFLDKNLTRTFCDTKLKLHRQTILLDREKALLPATQNHVQTEIQRRKNKENTKEEKEENRSNK